MKKENCKRIEKWMVQYVCFDTDDRYVGPPHYFDNRKDALDAARKIALGDLMDRHAESLRIKGNKRDGYYLECRDEDGWTRFDDDYYCEREDRIDYSDYDSAYIQRVY